MSDETTIERVKHDSLRAALHAVMQEVGYVQKSQTAPKAAGGFRYASDADLIRAVRPAMLRHGVVGPVPLEVKSADVETNKDSRQKHRITVCVRYLFQHVDSDDTLTIETVGQGADSTDKAPYKALTGAFKYALRQSLMIETGDDPEAEDDEGNRTDHPPGTPPDGWVSPEELDRRVRDAQANAERAGRAFVIRGLYDKASIHDDFDGRALASALKKRGLPSLSDLKHFVLWLGKPKLASMSQANTSKLLDWLETEPGGQRFEEFVKDCGIQ